LSAARARPRSKADRRAIDDQVIRLKRQLDRVVKTRELHRAARAKVPFPIVALVGYTNAGKSTLFNRVTGAEVLAKDMLFATLDPTMRGVVLPSGRKIILSDTVGFISDLPTSWSPPSAPRWKRCCRPI
jgi:GTP-binding protein HflX